MNDRRLNSIGMVCRRTGLKSDRLRAWERRYNVVEPIRSGGNQRLYSEEDIEKLLLLRQATDAGHRIAQIAHLPVGELQGLVEVELAIPPSPIIPTRHETATAHATVSACLSAVQRLDAAALRRGLRLASEVLSPEAVIEQLLVPLIHNIGDLWAEGGLRASHEHLATVVLRVFIEELSPEREVLDGLPRLLLTTPAGERHELGSLLAMATATHAGWDVTYLGPDLPAAEIAAAARQRGVRVIALSIVCPSSPNAIQDELATLRRHIGDDTGLIIGGRGAMEFEDTASDVGALIVEDLSGLPAALALFI